MVVYEFRECVGRISVEAQATTVGVISPGLLLVTLLFEVIRYKEGQVYVLPYQYHAISCH